MKTFVDMAKFVKKYNPYIVIKLHKRIVVLTMLDLHISEKQLS